MEHLLILALILAAVVLFATEKLRPDVVALAVALCLIASGAVTVEEGFSGFSNPAVLTVIAMFILSAGMVRTGIADSLAGIILASGARTLIPIVLMITLVVGLMSSFMNNIAACAILMPAVFAISERTRIPASQLLMPLAFGSLLGGLNTLIGTPPNLLASDALRNAGHAPFRMFDFLPTGLAVLATAMIYMTLIGHRLLPIRGNGARSNDSQSLRRFVTEVEVPRGSPLAGKTMARARFREDMGLSVQRMHRKYDSARGEDATRRPWLAFGRYGRDEDGRSYSFVPWPETEIREEDHLILEGDPEVVLRRQGANALRILGSQDAPVASDAELRLGEVALAPNSQALGRTVEEADFAGRYALQVLALRRSGQQVTERLASLRLEAGDVLLVRGSSEAMAAIAHDADFLVVRSLEHSPRDHRRAPLAVAILCVVVALAATGVAHISLAAMFGVLLMTLTGIVPARELYTQIDWKVVFLIACMMPLGIAMDDAHTGTASWLASGLVNLVGGNDPRLILAGVMVLTIGLTQVMSNAACVVLMAPVAIAMAEGMRLSPHTFMMGVAIAASTSFLTPIGHQANLLVYGVGNYRFTDYARVGGPMSACILATSVVILPWIWPFFGP